LQNEIHYICIDRRIVENGQTIIILNNEHRIVMPSNISQVPALLVIQGYNILYGDDILNFLKPAILEKVQIATEGNMEPVAFSLDAYGGGGGSVQSDNFCFIEPSDEMADNQMHNTRGTPMFTQYEQDAQTEAPSSARIKENEITTDMLIQQRQNDLSHIHPQPPIGGGNVTSASYNIPNYK
jgi:hypothetical protein